MIAFENKQKKVIAMKTKLLVINPGSTSTKAVSYTHLTLPTKA